MEIKKYYRLLHHYEVASNSVPKPELDVNIDPLPYIDTQSGQRS